MSVNKLTTLFVSFLIAGAFAAPSDFNNRTAPRTTKKTYNVDAHLLLTNWQPFQTYPDRVAQTLYPNSTLNVTQALLTDKVFTTLYPIGQPIIDVIYPEEVAILAKANITIDDLNSIAYNNYIAYTPLEIGCIGKNTVRQSTAQVVYIEAFARTYDNLRNQVEELYRNNGGAPGLFTAKPFFAHVSVATTKPLANLNDRLVLKGQCVANTTHEDPSLVSLQD